MFLYVSFSLILSRRLSEYIRYYNMQWIHCLLKRPASAFDDLVALLLLCAMTTAIASDPISSTLCVCVCLRANTGNRQVGERAKSVPEGPEVSPGEAATHDVHARANRAEMYRPAASAGVFDSLCNVI